MKDQVLEHIWQVRRSISEQNDFDSKKLVAYYKSRAMRKTYPISGSTGGQKFSNIAEPTTTYDAIR
jgi:hypothetical protein